MFVPRTPGIPIRIDSRTENPKPRERSQSPATPPRSAGVDAFRQGVFTRPRPLTDFCRSSDSSLEGRYVHVRRFAGAEGRTRANSWSAAKPTGGVACQGTKNTLFAIDPRTRSICFCSPSNRCRRSGSRVPAASKLLLTTQAYGSMCARRRSSCRALACDTGVVSAKVTNRTRV